MTADAAVVALGGGHGLYNSLTALRGLTENLTAIVTVADDGGSSGRLRDEMGIVPPGDLRMALAALCADTEWGRTWADVLQWRFNTTGPLHGHAVGNLLIAALWDRNGDVVDGLAWVARLLQCRGTVLPLAGEPLLISATVVDDTGVHHVDGQVAVASAHGRITDVWLTPTDPQVPQATVQAIADADVVVLGPGSWYTSVITHFAVPAVAHALRDNASRCVVVLNVGDHDVETTGTDRADDVAALRRLAGGFRPAAVLVDRSHTADDRVAVAVREWGADLIVADVRDQDRVAAHDPVLLRRALAEILERRPGSVTGP